jgi:murein DD-endopeptidase MepM/ murein hydrolase activator NlpD
MMLSLMLYHAILLKAAHEHWPIISDVVRFVERQEFAQRDRYMRENLDAMAIKVGELQAKLVHMEAVSERLAGMAGIKPEELKQMDVPTGGAGGALPALRGVPEVSSVEELRKITNSLDAVGDRNADLLTLIESHLFEKRLEALMIPSTPPVNGPVGSGFGFRSDPFTGRAALHTGLDFPSGVGTPIMAAAGGVVITASYHPQYGQMVEIDHGNGLVTRYGHTSRMLVKQGDLVKRGQLIANVGSTGRSTGPHLHFEVLVEGVQQDPARFLAGKAQAPGQPVAMGAGH